MQKVARHIFLFFLLLGPARLVLAQTDSLQLKQRLINDSVAHRTSLTEDKTLHFRNINAVGHYVDKKALAKIKKLEKKNDLPKLTRALEKYVHNFGIRNFYKDTRMLWQLGQLYQAQGDVEKAKKYFALVLKHHRADVRQVEQYYDSLTAGDADLYVPLEYYYELVEYRKNISAFRPPKGVYLKLGPEINSKFEDYGPNFRSEKDLFVFTSKRKFRGVSATPDEDLYYSYYYDGYWDEAKPFPKPINSTYNEGSATLSKDGSTIYFSRCECPNCNGNCDLFVSYLQTDSSWSVAKNLGPQVNSPGWDSQPSLSQNEDTLYFASDRLGGFGLSDIYFSVKQKNGEWGKAQNMGPVINTRDNDLSPFYHPKYHVLYFSSRGHLLNNGDFDIYKTYRVNGHWQEPRNIGPLVNGAGSEYYFTIDSNSENLYYARSEKEDLKNLDLYSFPLPMEAHPLAVTRFEGILTDSVTNKPLKGIVSIIDLTNGIEVASKYIREDGSFAFDLIDNSRYMMLIQGEDFFSVDREFDLKSDTLMQVITTMIDYSLPLIFKNLEFDEGKAVVKESMFPSLDRIILFLTDHPNSKIEIWGHTDSAGDPELNLRLSQERADAIKAYIVQNGMIEENRIASLGFGSSKPLRDEVTDEDRRINRRVEFHLIMMNKK